MTFTFRSFFYFLAGACLLFVVLYYGRELLVPISFALLFAFILYPVCHFLERWGLGRILAILLAMLLVVLLLAGGVVLFSAQIVRMSGELGDFSDKLMEIISQVIVFANENIPVFTNLSRESLLQDGSEWLKSSWQGLASSTFNGTFSFFSGTFLVMIYTFLLLLYRGGIVKALRQSVPAESRERVAQLVTDVQQVGQNYLFGMVLLIAILGTLNSVGLWIIGLDHAFLFGYLAGLLVIIPYAGTLLGGLLPTVYALMTHDSLWMPLAVVGLFWLVQMIEGNFLSPRIIGGKLSVNAFTAIFSLILGGSIWGMAGMVLFLPLAAIAKVTFGYFETLRPIAELMGDSLYEPQQRPGFWQTLRTKWQAFRNKSIEP